MMLLPLVSFAVSAGSPVISAPVMDAITSPRAAQVRLAATLAEADAIESVVARGRTVAFAIVRRGEPMRVEATTARTGEVIALTVDTGAGEGELAQGVSWLATEMQDVTAIVRLVVGEHGGVLLSTNDGRSYLIGPRQIAAAPSGNEAVEARWGAAWSDERQ